MKRHTSLHLEFLFKRALPLNFSPPLNIQNKTIMNRVSLTLEAGSQRGSCADLVVCKYKNLISPGLVRPDPSWQEMYTRGTSYSTPTTISLFADLFQRYSPWSFDIRCGDRWCNDTDSSYAVAIVFSPLQRQYGDGGFLKIDFTEVSHCASREGEKCYASKMSKGSSAGTSTTINC